MCEGHAPDEHTMQNRQAQDALMREAAMRGNSIAGAYYELESAASQTGWGRCIVGTMFDYRDTDEIDEIRPY